MVIRSRPTNSRPLTGKYKIVVGLFGNLIVYMQVRYDKGDIWKRCKTQEEYEWCKQFK